MSEGTYLLSPWCHHLSIKLCSELYSEVIVGSYSEDINTQHLLLIFFFNIKFWLGGSYFLLILKACESWAYMGFIRHIASFTQFLPTPVKIAFPFNKNKMFAKMKCSSCLFKNKSAHSLYPFSVLAPRIFTG